MYKEFFSLSEVPFSIAPDARYLYMSSRYQEALAHLYYGVEGTGGIVLLTGEIGTGKTTICRFFLENLPAKCEVAYIYNPMLSVTELLITICEEYGITPFNNDQSNKALINAINQYLLEKHALGYKLLLIIDEAQNLSIEVLEQLRLLTNLETHERKLLQIILIGQPELRKLVENKALTQLSQRIVARYHLSPLSLQETILYVNHRLIIAGSGNQLFTKRVIRYIHKISRGIPRLVNLLCDRSLLGAYTQSKHFVDKKIVEKAARESLGYGIPINGYKRPTITNWLLGSLLLITTLTSFIIYFHQRGLLHLPSLEPWPFTSYPTIEKPFWSSFLQESNESKAITTLFKEWGLDYDSTSSSQNSFCQQAKSNGLSCLSGYGNIDTLRELDIPAILELSKEGESIYATLTHLNAKNATLIFDDHSKQLSIPTLEKYWNGNYRAILKASGENMNISAHDSNVDDVDASKNKLAVKDDNLTADVKKIIPSLTKESGHRE